MVTIIAATRWPGLPGALIEAAAAAQIDFWGKASVVGAQFNTVCMQAWERGTGQNM